MAGGKYADARRDAIERHNAILARHLGAPISRGTELYILCSCGLWKGSFLNYEEHCRKMVSAA
jgi:hypothetical protein